MNVSEKGNGVLAMDVARDDTELFVVTENGFGKRTPIADYPVKGRGTKGVKTIQLTDRKGGLAGALVVREHQELLFISQSGMVQRTSVRGISTHGPGDSGSEGHERARRRHRQRRGARGRERGGPERGRGRERRRRQSCRQTAMEPRPSTAPSRTALEDDASDSGAAC